ncbi:MAG: hypothetical protein K8F58_09615 [Bauldia sp.]|nr:hypothetical protein [Bauldia sp.]
MASRSPDDVLLPLDASPAGTRPLRTQVAAFIPITIALLGVAVILLGGMPASKSSLMARQTIDPLTTGSIGGSAAPLVDAGGVAH